MIKYTNLNGKQTLIFLFTRGDPQLSSWLGQFNYFLLWQSGTYHSSLLENRYIGVIKEGQVCQFVFEFNLHSKNWCIIRKMIIIHVFTGFFLTNGFTIWLI